MPNEGLKQRCEAPLPDGPLSVPYMQQRLEELAIFDSTAKAICVLQRKHPDRQFDEMVFRAFWVLSKQNELLLRLRAEAEMGLPILIQLNREPLRIEP